MLLALITSNHSCTIQKRIYRNGYFISAALFDKNESKQSKYFNDHSNQIDKKGFEKIEKDSLFQNNDVLKSLQGVKIEESPSIPESIKSKKVVKQFQNIDLKMITSIKKGAVNPLKSKVISKENKLRKRFDKADFLDSLFFILRCLLFAISLILLGLGIYLLFPSLSIFVSILFALGFVALLLFIFLVIYITCSNSVC